MNNPIANLRSLPPEAVEKLREAGIETIEQFYEIAKHKDSRQGLSAQTGIEEFTLEAWSADAGNHILMANCTWS